MNGLHLIGDLGGCRCDPQLLLDGKRFERCAWTSCAPRV